MLLLWFFMFLVVNVGWIFDDYIEVVGVIWYVLGSYCFGRGFEVGMTYDIVVVDVFVGLFVVMDGCLWY